MGDDWIWYMQDAESRGDRGEKFNPKGGSYAFDQCDFPFRIRQHKGNG